jgi:hypothetical protein
MRATKGGGTVKRSLTTVGVLMVLWLAIGSCWASESEEPQAEQRRVNGAVWVLPPAYEFPISDGGHLSLEIGVTRALWLAEDAADNAFGPRIGAFVYPAGRLEGLALYAGLAEGGPEGGIWVVWRADTGDGSSARGRALSFRLGVGIASDGGGSADSFPDIGLGAAVGFGL